MEYLGIFSRAISVSKRNGSGSGMQKVFFYFFIFAFFALFTQVSYGIIDTAFLYLRILTNYVDESPDNYFLKSLKG